MCFFAIWWFKVLIWRHHHTLVGGANKSTVDDPTKFLGKLIDVSVHSTKIKAGKSMIDRFTILLTRCVCIQSTKFGFTVCLLSVFIVDCVGPSTITKLENITTKFLKQWLQLLQSALRVILYYPGVCSSSISLTVKHYKLSLLANVSPSSDPTLRELALQPDFGSGMLQLNDKHHGILSQAREQLNSIPCATKLYQKCKKVANAEEQVMCTQKLDSLSVQCKLKDAASLDMSMHLWNRLLLGLHPGKFSFILRVSSDTLPTPVNLQRWKIQTSSSYQLYDCCWPTSAHIFEWLPHCTTTRQVHLPSWSSPI